MHRVGTRIGLAHVRRVLHRDLGDCLGRRLACPTRRSLRRTGSRIGHGACRALALEGGKSRRLSRLHRRLGHSGGSLLDGIHHGGRGARRSLLHSGYGGLDAIAGRLRPRLHSMGDGLGGTPRGNGDLRGRLARLLGSLASGVLHGWRHTLGSIPHSRRNALGGILHGRHGGTGRTLGLQACLASESHNLACQIHIVTPSLRSQALIPPGS